MEQSMNVMEQFNKDRISTLSFTDDQRHAYEVLLDFISADYNDADYKRALSGPAGTGKTYLVKALIANCGRSFSTIGLAAPTHKACRVLQESIGLSGIKVNTIQSDLGLRLNFDIEKFDPANPPFDPRGKVKIGVYKLYVVDEASMIPKALLKFLEKVCKTNHCKIIYIGDESQLPPVKDKRSEAFVGVKTCFLKKIVRQEEDNPIRHLLELLRHDIEHKTYTFLNYIYSNKEEWDKDNIKGYRRCNNAEFMRKVYENFSDEQLTRNVDFCKVVGYTNKAVSNWNKFIRQSIIEGSDKSILTKNDLIMSYVTIVDAFNSPIIKNSEDYIIQDIVNYVHPQYELKGFLCRFIAIHGGQTTNPLFVLDHTDKYNISKYCQISDRLIMSAKASSGSARAARWKEYYSFKESCLLLANILKPDGKTILYSRDLDYGFSITSHKSQGSTYDTTLVDVNDIVFDSTGRPWTDVEQVNRRLYVACSRSKNKLYLNYGK